MKTWYEMELEFKPLYFGDKLHIINPRGVIGVATLWSKPEYVIQRFREAGVDLNPATSPIALFGTLYGNGLREMLRNLLYNPQIEELWICGRDRSGSLEELQNYFNNGLEPVEGANISYALGDASQEARPWRIRGSKRLIDGLVTPDLFYRKPKIRWLGYPEDSQTLSQIRTALANFQPNSLKGLMRPAQVPPLPEVQTLYFPSNPRGHQIVREHPLDAWLELLFCLSRFGRRVTLKKGDRLELPNVRVVVEEPREEDSARLSALDLDPAKLGKYYSEFLEGELRPDETYNYGHRLRQYFGMDAVEVLAGRLRKDPEDRKAYFTLWDNARDLQAKESRPCFVSVFFRKFAEKLMLTATFRTHNALDAWLTNFYGLMALQRAVAEQADLPPGAITVFSHSISIDPGELDRALNVVGKRQWKMHLDPMGYFRVSLDGQEILVEYRFEDVTLKEYRGRTAVALQHQIARDLAVGDINHAMYLGRQLAKAELALKEGREFVQD
jgi:thymidylate synthase